MLWSAVVCLVAVELVDGKTSSSVNKTLHKVRKARFGIANSSHTKVNATELEKKLQYLDSEMMKLWKEIASQRVIIGDIKKNILLMDFQNTTNEEVLGTRINRTKRILRLYHAHKARRDRTMKKLLKVEGRKGNNSDESARIELMGVPERPHEDALDIARKFGAIIGMANIGGLVGACRINASTKPRPILVQLRTNEQMKGWLEQGQPCSRAVSASALDPAYPDQGVFVINAMSDMLRQQLGLARIVAAQREISSIWVKNDTIYMMHDSYDKPVEIRDASDFAIFKGSTNQVILYQLEITGVPERKNEDVLSLVRQLALKIGARDLGCIIAAGRLKSANMKPPHPIIAVLRTEDDYQYWLQRWNMNLTAKIFHKSNPKTKIEWFEYRTLDRMLFEAAKKLAIDLHYYDVFTLHGRILLQKTRKGKLREVRTVMDLRILLAEYELRNSTMNMPPINDPDTDLEK